MVKITTPEQMKRLVELMEQNVSLARNFKRGIPQTDDIKNGWESVAATLNYLGPPVRTQKEWQKVWFDAKFKVKEKLLYNKKQLESTGGGPFKQKYLNELDAVIVQLLDLNSVVNPGGKVFGNTESSSAVCHPGSVQNTIQCSSSYLQSSPSTSNYQPTIPSTSSNLPTIISSVSLHPTPTIPLTSTTISPPSPPPTIPLSAKSPRVYSTTAPIATNSLGTTTVTTAVDDPVFELSDFEQEIEQYTINKKGSSSKKKSKPASNHMEKMLEKQTQMQEALYNEVKESLKRIEGHQKESSRYERKRYYLEEERLKLYKMQLEREENQRITNNKFKIMDLEIRKKHLEIEERKLNPTDNQSEDTSLE